MTEEDLIKFIKFVEEDILSNIKELDDNLENYIKNLVHAVKIYMAENSCGCYLITNEDKKFRDYILWIVHNTEE